MFIRSIGILLFSGLFALFLVLTADTVYAPTKDMNGTMKMGYAHVSIGEYGRGGAEELTLHLDARYLDRITLRVDCIGLDTGHLHKEIDLYQLLNISRPKQDEDKSSSDEPKETTNEVKPSTEKGK